MIGIVEMENGVVLTHLVMLRYVPGVQEVNVLVLEQIVLDQKWLPILKILKLKLVI